MAWIYFQELAVLDLGLANGSEPFVIVNKTDTHRAFCCPECKAVILTERRSGTTLERCGGGVLPKIEIIFGGFPCQDISFAGIGKGLEGERSGLFFEIIRLASELRPKFIFLENVPAITIRGLERITMELSSLGYDCRWTIVSASEVGAPHQRDRWFLLAYDSCGQEYKIPYAYGEPLRYEPEQKYRSEGQTEFRDDGQDKSMAESSSERLSIGRQPRINSSKKEKVSRLFNKPERCSTPMADADSLRKQPEQENREFSPYRSGHRRENVAYAKSLGSLEGRFRERTPPSISLLNQCGESIFESIWWKAEPEVGRMVNGIPFRVDQVKCLGNSVVPASVKKAFKKLIGLSYAN